MVLIPFRFRQWDKDKSPTRSCGPGGRPPQPQSHEMMIIAPANNDGIFKPATMEDDDVDLLGLGGVVPADPNADVSKLVAVNIVEMGSSIDPAEKTLIMSHANRAKGPLPTASSSSGKKIRSSKGGSKRNKSPMSRFLGSSTEEEPSTISRSSKPTRRGRTSGVSDDKKKYEGRNMKAKAPPPPLSESSSPPQANKEKVQNIRSIRHL